MFDSRVVHIFDEMESDYDQITDLWYSWLFSRLHFLITKKIISKWTGSPKVLDIGCGTGYQSLLYAKAGAKVTGVDISGQLLKVAKQKRIEFQHAETLSFFEPKFGFVKKYERRINELLSQRNSAQISFPDFMLGDAQELEFANESFDHINCCGSTLSFIDDYNLAIKEMHRVLKPGGTFVLELESKANPDLWWTFLDSSVLFGLLGYETSFKEAKEQVAGEWGKHIKVEYPFGDIRNPVYMNIRLFNKKKIKRELKEAGLLVSKCYSIHSVTNLIPSTVLHNPEPGAILTGNFNVLAKIEEKIPFFLPGCSLILMGRKAS
jgi:MPBQ/MSBQ methyltransferase